MVAASCRLLDEPRAAHELIEVEEPVDIRQIARFVDPAETELLFCNIIDYDLPVLSRMTNGRDRIAIAMCPVYGETEAKLRRRISPRSAARRRCCGRT